MKVFNEEVRRHRGYEAVKAAFEKIYPEALELIEHDIVRIDTREPRWDRHRVLHDGELREVRIGGIDITVEASSVNYVSTSGYKVIFGVRTDKEGYIDMGKLAKKFKEKMSSIKETIEVHERNMEIRERQRESRHVNAEVLDKLVEEGLLEHIYEVTERSDGFEVSLHLKDESELRSYLEWKNGILARREVKA
jgi:hypothetical protein